MVLYGISTAAAPTRAYWKVWLNTVDFTALEINLFKSIFPFSQLDIFKYVKPTIRKFDISLHSRSDPLFGDNKILTKANQQTFLAEIEIAGMLRARQLIFHLPKIDRASTIHNKILDFFPKAIEQAESRSVQLLLENAPRTAFSRPENLLFVFDNFPKIKLALDIGHLFRAECNEKVNRFDFLDELYNHAVYAHVHDSIDGYTHKALIHTPETEEFFRKIKKSKIEKYIMEAHTYLECVETRQLLESYEIYEHKKG